VESKVYTFTSKPVKMEVFNKFSEEIKVFKFILHKFLYFEYFILNVSLIVIQSGTEYSLWLPTR
jgi:hypothetical protein